MLSRSLAFTLLAAALAAPLGARPASADQRLVVPLTDPSRPARLEVGLVMGSVKVVAGKAGEVVVVADGREDDEEPKHRDREPGADRAGMRRISGGGLGLDVEEKDNRVEVGTDSWASPVDLVIEVPAASSVELSTVNAGDLSVEGLSGELVLHNTNGDVSVRDVSGPVDATTVNGDVSVRFSAAMAEAPMAFSTLNGDVDVTLPAGAGVDVLLRSDNGDIYTDFDVELRRSPAKVEEDRKKGSYRVSVGQELRGKIGGGGPELFLKTFNGDVLLRRAGG